MVNQALPHDELARTAVAEEGAEVAIELCKLTRFGPFGVNPVDGTTPAERLARELGDLLGSIDFLLETHPYLRADLIQQHRDAKKPRLLHFNDPANWS